MSVFFSPIRCSDRARLRVHDRPPVIGKPERSRAVNRRRRAAAHDQIAAHRHSAVRLRAALRDGERIAAVAELRAACRRHDLAKPTLHMDPRAAVSARRIAEPPADRAAAQRIIYRHIAAQLDIIRR